MNRIIVTIALIISGLMPIFAQTVQEVHTNSNRTYELMSCVIQSEEILEKGTFIDKCLYESQIHFGAHMYRRMYISYKYEMEVIPMIDESRIIFYGNMLEKEQFMKTIIFDGIFSHLNFDPVPRIFTKRILDPSGSNSYFMGTHGFNIIMGNAEVDNFHDDIIERSAGAFIATQHTGYIPFYSPQIMAGINLFQQFFNDKKITLSEIIFFQRTNNLRGFFEKVKGKSLSNNEFIKIFCAVQKLKNEMDSKKTYKEIMEI